MLYADFDYFIGLGNSIKEHPDVVVAQSNPQTGMRIGAILYER